MTYLFGKKVQEAVFERPGCIYMAIGKIQHKVMANVRESLQVHKAEAVWIMIISHGFCFQALWKYMTLNIILLWHLGCTVHFSPAFPLDRAIREKGNCVQAMKCHESSHYQIPQLLYWARCLPRCCRLLNCNGPLWCIKTLSKVIQPSKSIWKLWSIFSSVLML